jgi:Chlorophyll A-B binding protein
MTSFRDVRIFFPNLFHDFFMFHVQCFPEIAIISLFATTVTLIKMFKTLAIASLIGSVAAFGPARGMTVRTSSKVSMSAEFLPGAVAPLGYFDPLSLSAGKTTGEVKKIREAELKHGR